MGPPLIPELQNNVPFQSPKFGEYVQGAPNRGPEIAAVGAALAGLGVGCVCLRLYTRIRISKFLGVDDLFICLAAFFALIHYGLYIAFIFFGDGEHLSNLPQNILPGTRKVIYLLQIFYLISPSFVKVSILTLYLRLFPHPRFRIFTWFMICLVSFGAVLFIFITIFACHPITPQFAHPNDVHCLNKSKLVLGTAGFNFGTEFIIFIMPMKLFYSLKVSKREKALVFLTFGVGFIACIASIMRIWTISIVYNSTDATWKTFGSSISTLSEIFVGLTCAALPACKPVVVHCLGIRLRRSQRGSDDSNSEDRTKNQSGTVSLARNMDLKDFLASGPPSSSRRQSSVLPPMVPWKHSDEEQTLESKDERQGSEGSV